MHSGSTGGVRSSLADWSLVVALLVTLGLASGFRLSMLVVPEMDEGIYVYAGKLIAEGSQPYRDFMFAHPPLVPYLAAVLWKIGGSLESTRWLAIGITLVSSLPLFVLARRLTGSAAAGLFAVALYVTGLIWIANLGRTLRLEPTLNMFLIAGAVLWWLGRGRWSALAAGACFALAVATKLVAVVPIAILASADLAWPVSGKADWQRRGVLALGGALVLLPLAAWCLDQPGFREWAWTAQFARQRVSLEERLVGFGQALVRFPPLLLGLLLAALQLRQPEPRRRALALTTIASTVASVFLFKTFFRHYLALALPWVAVLMAIAVAEFCARPRQRAALVVSCFVLAACAPVAFTLISLRVSPQHSAGAATVLPYLSHRQGYLLSPYPDFALLTGRELVPWYFIVDNYLALSIGKLSDSEFAAAVDRTSNVVVLSGELDGLPQTKALLGARFRPLPVDAHWSAWERRTSDESAAPR
jgi:hypothetical protein